MSVAISIDLYSKQAIRQQSVTRRLPRREGASPIVQIIINNWRKLSKSPTVTAPDICFRRTHLVVPIVPHNVHKRLWYSGPSIRIWFQRWLASADLAQSFGRWVADCSIYRQECNVWGASSAHESYDLRVFAGSILDTNYSIRIPQRL